MSHQNILEQIKNSEVSGIKIAITDIDGVLRGKQIHKSKLLKSVKDNIGFCNVVFGWDINDVCYDNTEVSGWHTGYPDALASVDLSTLRKVPWDNNKPFFLADFENDTTGIAEVCPRTLLKRVRRECFELGFKPYFANEFEWFNFKETPDSLAEKNHTSPTPLTPGMFGYSLLRASQHQDFFNDLYELLHQFGVPVEGIHTETGWGVYEACIHYADILKAADRAILFKTGVKEIAYRHGFIASFMAKWNNKLPGCSGHIHQSLWNVNGDKNLFFDDKKPNNISKLMEHYIAGQLYCLPYLMPMYAPTVNSYKRFVAGSWAATTASWGIENRTTALRVINNNQNATRLETRVPGADTNPYLTMAASLAAGLYGIKHEMTLDISPTVGNEYENSNNQKLPKTLYEATLAMKNSTLPEKLFGDKFTNHFIKTREWEWRQFTEQVTDWEMKRYFELV